MSNKLKVLHYYWCQFDDNDRKGGGIKVYLNNILPRQVELGMNVYSLNSGIDYDIVKKEPYIQYLGENEGVKKFSLFNSPIIAPSKADFYNKSEYIINTNLKSLVDNFIEKEGPFDVIHFHSLEGLGVKILELKEKYPTTKFIYSVHNYFPFCPQVNLWYQDRQNCTNYHSGENCTHCIEKIPSLSNIKRYYSLITLFKQFHLNSLLNKVMQYGKKYRQYISSNNAFNRTNSFGYDFINPNEYVSFRENNVKSFNSYMDNILCVSKRVKEICESMGVDKNILMDLYIGTDFAKNQASYPLYDVKDGILKIIYAGYMRPDKGFYFFLEMLEDMPDSLAQKISLVIAARNEDNDAIVRINKLRNKFYSVEYYDGYTRNNFNDILRNVNLGVVPVMWEDNLPQVAMELKAMGIPVIATELGGASELSSSPLFKITPGDTSDFINKIAYFVNNPELLTKYYDNSIVLKTIDEHCLELDNIYKGL